MTVSSQFPVQETLKQPRSRVLTVMSAMRSAGQGYEDIYVALNAMGFPISRDACRRFVIPKTHGARSDRGSERALRGMQTQN